MRYGESAALCKKRIGADAIHPSRYTLLVPGVVRRCHRAGIRVHTWTVDDPISIRMMLEKGWTPLSPIKPDLAKKKILQEREVPSK